MPTRKDFNKSLGWSQVEGVCRYVIDYQIVLSYDDATPARPLLKYGMTFLPDAHLNPGHQKICAMEVKFLRDSDPSRSQNKAVGQTFMFRTLGYDMSIGLIFDLRSYASLYFQNDLNKLSNSSERVLF